MKLFLIDAYALIYRSYYAFIKNPRINSKGMNTSAIFGFINSLEDVLKREKPTHVAVAFDPAGPTFRHEAFEAYKAQREETPEAIRQSVPIIKEIIQAYRIPILEVPRYEADDVIGTIAKQAALEGFEVYMMTPDKDYGQLVADHIFMYRPKFGGDYETLGVAEVLEKYQLKDVSQVIDLLGLMGDSSDNIPGCPGVGEKTAQKLLAEFGDIENLLAHTDQLKGAQKKKIEENAEQIRFSKFLATIKTDAPIQFNAADCVREKPDEARLIEIYTDLEFRTFIDRLTKSDQKQPKKAPAEPSLFEIFAPESTDDSKYSILAELKSTPHTYHLVDTEEKRVELARFLEGREFFAFDTETDSVEPLTAGLVGMSFAVEEFEAWYVPVPADKTEATRIVNLFAPALRDPRSTKIGQNIKFDILVLRKYGLRVEGPLFDTMIAHYLLNPELRHNMDYLAETYLKYKTVHIEELIGPKGKSQRSMRDVPVAEVAEYAAEDADVTLRLRNQFAPKIEEAGVHELFYTIEMPLIYVLAEMEATGVTLDTAALKQSSIELTATMNQLEREIIELAGKSFNVNSTQQVGEILSVVAVGDVAVEGDGVAVDNGGGTVVQILHHKALAVAVEAGQHADLDAGVKLVLQQGGTGQAVGLGDLAGLDVVVVLQPHGHLGEAVVQHLGGGVTVQPVGGVGAQQLVVQAGLVGLNRHVHGPAGAGETEHLGVVVHGDQDHLGGLRRLATSPTPTATTPLSWWTSTATASTTSPM